MAADATGLEQHEGRRAARQARLAMRDCPVPVVARIQGLCLAGGIGLACGADVVLARESASFGMPEIDRGLWPFMVSALLARHLSPKHAMDRMLSGDRFDAKTAYEIGLVSRVFDDAPSTPTSRLCRAGRRSAGRGTARQGRLDRCDRDHLVPVALEAMQAQLSLL